MNFNITDNVQFVLSSSVEVVGVVFAFMALLITLALSYRRLSSSIRFTFVVLLNVLSFCALIVLIGDVKTENNSDVSAVLLTYGTSQQQIDSLDIDKGTNLYILSSFSSQPWQSSLDFSYLENNVIAIDNVTEVFLFEPLLNKLYLYGDGLLSEQWKYFHSYIDIKVKEEGLSIRVNIDYFPSKVRTGPINLTWPKHLVIGQKFHIKGTFITAKKDHKRIYNITLSDMYDEVVDELTIKNNEDFDLLTSVKTQGLFTYRLKVYDDNKQLIISEPISFSVKTSGKIKVAIKQSSASFESKYLKNWLAEQGEEVFVLTQTSKDKYIQQTVNLTSERPTGNKKEYNPEILNKELAASWLRYFDLLYMDGRAFSSLGEKALDQINEAIKQGLGLIIIVDDEFISSMDKVSSNPLLANVLAIDTIQINDDKDISSTIPSWGHSQNAHSMSYKNIKLPMKRGDAFMKGSEGQPLWLKQPHGLGTVALSLIGSSYQWVISGEKSHYSEYWQYIIEHVSRQNRESGWQYSPKNQIYYKGQSYNICAQLYEEDIKDINVKRINLLASLITESAYCGLYWANKEGWNNFELLNEKNKNMQYSLSLNTQNIFIYSQGDWQAWQQFLKHEASYLASKTRLNKAWDSVYVSAKKINTWWLLFISLSLLWVERKTF